MSTVVAVAASPAITCPAWCTVSQTQHVDDLPDFEGFVIHRLELETVAFDGLLEVSSSTYTDGTPDPKNPRTEVRIDTGHDTYWSVDEAEDFARSILAFVEKVRS